MFKKVTIIFAALALLLTVFYGITLLKQRGVQPEPSEPTGPTVSEDGSSLFLPNKNSEEPLLVPNFLAPQSPIQPMQVIEDTVSGSNTALLKRAENYSVYGFTGSDGSSFMVALHDDNLRQARLDGEQALLGILGITPEQACATNITVVVQSPYDNQVSVTDVRPSFCPNRVDLPTAGAEGNTTEESIDRTVPDTAF